MIRVAALTVALLAAATPAFAAAGPVYWDWPEQLGFDKLELDGVGLDSHGRLMPGLAGVAGGAGQAEIVWDLVVAGDGSVFAATGNSGEVWRLAPGGEPGVVATLPQAELFAILETGGAVYAGGGPDGLLLRLEAGREPQTWADLTESYVWDAIAGPRGRIYLAAGSPAAVYEVSGRDQVRRVATLPAANALCLAWVPGGAGALLVGTERPGLLCRIDPGAEDRFEVLHEAEQVEIRSLEPGPDGAWYALATSPRPGEGAGRGQAAAEGTRPENPLRSPAAAGGGAGAAASAPASAVHRIEPDGLVTLFWSGERRVAAIAHDPRWGWLAATNAPPDSGGALLLLDPPRGGRRLAAWKEGEATSLLVPPDPQAPVVVGLSHPARLLQLRDGTGRGGSATSEPLDAGLAVRWGRLRWQGEQPSGAQVRWRVRGGPRSVPDATWTGWSSPWSEQDHPLDLPPLRFLQWQVELSGEGPRVASVTVSGRQPNRAPLIEGFELLPEGALERGGMISRQENVTETLRGGVQVEYSAASGQDRRAGLLEASSVRPVRTFTWRASDPNGDRLAYRLEYRQPGRETWRPIGDWTRETIGSWNTAAVPDGVYVVRLVASDDPDNPRGEALEATRVLPAVVVDRTPPSITEFELEPAPEGFRIRFRAADAASPLHRAQVELPDGRIERLDPVDGIADSPSERFDRLVRLAAGPGGGPAPPWVVRVVVTDRPGNAAVAEGEVPADRPAPAPRRGR